MRAGEVGIYINPLLVSCPLLQSLSIILTEVLMNVNRGVVQRVNEHVHEVARWGVAGCTSGLRPGVAASEAISGCKDELVSTCRSDTVDSSLWISYVRNEEMHSN